MMVDTQAIFRSVVERYDEMAMNGSLNTIDDINGFIDTYENVFLTFGMFVRGLRVKNANFVAKPHQTIDGILGIISLNIEIFRRKINA